MDLVYKSHPSNKEKNYLSNKGSRLWELLESIRKKMDKKDYPNPILKSNTRSLLGSIKKFLDSREKNFFTYKDFQKSLVLINKIFRYLEGYPNSHKIPPEQQIFHN